MLKQIVSDRKEKKLQLQKFNRRSCYEQLYAVQLENLKRNEQILRILQPPKTEWEENRKPKWVKDIETLMKNIFTNRRLGPEGFTGEFYQNFYEDLLPLLVKLF